MSEYIVRGWDGITRHMTKAEEKIVDRIHDEIKQYEANEDLFKPCTLEELRKEFGNKHV